MQTRRPENHLIRAQVCLQLPGRTLCPLRDEKYKESMTPSHITQRMGRNENKGVEVYMNKHHALSLSLSLPLSLSTTLPLYHSASLPLSLSTTLPLYHSPSLPLTLSTTLPLYHSPITHGGDPSFASAHAR
jgi:hypothetical protein